MGFFDIKVTGENELSVKFSQEFLQSLESLDKEVVERFVGGIIFSKMKSPWQKPVTIPLFETSFVPDQPTTNFLITPTKEEASALGFEWNKRKRVAVAAGTGGVGVYEELPVVAEESTECHNFTTDETEWIGVVKPFIEDDGVFGVGGKFLEPDTKPKFGYATNVVGMHNGKPYECETRRYTNEDDFLEDQKTIDILYICAVLSETRFILDQDGKFSSSSQVFLLRGVFR